MEAYAGWIEYQAFQLEETTAAFVEARATGTAHPLDEKEALVTGAGLFDWTQRILGEPAALSERHGTFEWAYRSAVDGTGQPFVITVPEAYDGSRPWPLMVLLQLLDSPFRAQFVRHFVPVIPIPVVEGSAPIPPSGESRGLGLRIWWNDRYVREGSEGFKH